MADRNNEAKFHIELHKDFDVVIAKYQKQFAKKTTPMNEGMTKPHIVKHLKKMTKVVSTIKEQSGSELGQASTQGDTLGEVVSLHRPSINTVDDVVGQNLEEPPPPTSANDQSTAQFESFFDSPSPPTARTKKCALHAI